MGKESSFFAILLNLFPLHNSHPKYRLALKEKLPCLVCGETEKPPAAVAETVSQTSNGTTDGKA